MPLSTKWKKTIDDGMKSPFRGTWDGVVTGEAILYFQRLMNTPGYVWIDPKVIVAILWVESGGPMSSTWNNRVMQIGNPGDLGWPALRKHEGATDVVVRPDLLKVIDSAKPGDLNNPVLNIWAGMAYLFVRMSISEIGSVQEGQDTTIHSHVVTAKETATKIAQREGTTVEVLKALNPTVNIDNLHEGQILFFVKAHMGRKITGWRPFDPTTIAQRYNVGDRDYAEKLRYVLAKLNEN